MYLDYSKLPVNTGVTEAPTIVLKTLGSDIIGTIPGVFNLKCDIQFSEPSEMTFDVPSHYDGVENWIYERLTGHMQIYTEHYGVYLLSSVSEDTDGSKSVKHITAYSIEKELESKKFFLNEGTVKFAEPTNLTDENTVLGQILASATGWSAGYIAPTVAQRYRTFEQYDDYLLSFVYKTIPEKYRCVFVFEPYNKTINVYDIDIDYEMLPIYLDCETLLSSVSVEEMDDEMVTALSPYGADDLDIREVNPIGTNWIYDLSYFISKGDLGGALADKWQAWQRSIQNNRSLYEGLSALRASATSQLVIAETQLTELNNELENLTGQQNTTVQALALEITDEGKNSQQQLLDDINAKLVDKRREIAAQEVQISEIKSLLDSNNPQSYTAQIATIVAELGIKNYFTDEEYRILSHYFIEQDLVEETIVASDLDTTVSGQSYSLDNASLGFTGSSITKIDMTDDFAKTMHTLSGGSFALNGTLSLSADIIRGTVEVADSGKFVISIYAGNIKAGSSTAASGLITISGTTDKIDSDIIKASSQETGQDGNIYEIEEFKGSYLKFTPNSGFMYITANVSDYQRYAAKKELYDFALDVLKDSATPTYEFSVDSGNFLFAQDFEPFRNALELGKGIYLKIGNDKVIKPYLIGFELDFEDPSKFSMVFSTRFKRYDNVNTLKDMVEQSYSSSRSFDASKYTYNLVADQASQVSEFMSSSIDAAKNAVLAAKDQSVKIDSAGITVSSDGKYQLRLVGNMLAMTDNNWETAKLGIGRFATAELGEYYGINAEVVGGKLIVGNNLIIENPNDEGVMQFKVDSSGAWLNNSTFVLQKDNGGKLLIDPKYGIVAGTADLFQTNGTTVSPTFIDEDGKIVFDDDGMPTDSNFFLDLRNGNAYFRGQLNATSGKIGGFSIADDFLYSSSGMGYVALNGSKTNEHSIYAQWVGDESPGKAPFWLKKNGDMKAKDATFTGITHLTGIFKADTPEDSEEEDDGWLEGCGIRVGKDSSADNGYKFYVSRKGDVSILGNLTLKNGAISWSNLDSSVSNKITSAKQIAKDIADGKYSGTFIDGTKIISPRIYAVADSEDFAEMSNDAFTLYQDGVEKVKITYGNSDSYYASVTLGRDQPALLEKKQSQGHKLWLGNDTHTNGIQIQLNSTGGVTFFQNGSQVTLASLQSSISKLQSAVAALQSGE